MAEAADSEPNVPTGSEGDWYSRVREDQSACWQRGEGRRVEDYLAQHPMLAEQPERLIDLILAEVLLRADGGESPTLEEYLERFPTLGEPLRQRWAAIQLILQPTGDASPSSSEEPLTLQTGAKRRLRAPVPNLPGYEILSELGGGGMGIVYQARQLALDRLVAVKFIRNGPLAGFDELDRFQREAEAIARLAHPGFVQVHEFGNAAPVLYLVMEYLSGGTLTQRLRSRRPSIEESVRLVRDLARAMQTAHAVGVVHRDLKPGNILFGEDGRARICDFGLARLMDSESELTGTEVVMGTPAYMSPEQASGQSHDVGPTADVWALGVILYECLTGRQPFRGETRNAILDQVRQGEPIPLRAIREEIPAELEMVCLYCLEKDPGRRCATAAELADELDRFLVGTPIQVRPPSRARRWLRRLNPYRTILPAVIVLALCAVIAWMVWREDPLSPAVRRLTQQLAAGQRVILVESNGPPRWVKTLWGRGQLNQHQRGTFLVETWSPCVLELLPRIPCKRYRVRGEIAVTRGTRGVAGLVVSLDDRGRRAENRPPCLAAVFEEPERGVQGMARPGEARLELRHYSGEEGQAAADSRVLVRVPLQPPPERSSGLIWHNLELDVDSESVTFRLNEQGIGRVAVGQIAEMFERHGGVGLISANCSATFRRVVVEPLEGSE